MIDTIQAEEDPRDDILRKIRKELQDATFDQQQEIALHAKLIQVKEPWKRSFIMFMIDVLLLIGK